jgi:hypothetical protein
MLGSGESGTITVYFTPDCGCEPGTYSVVLNAESVITGNEVSRTIAVETIKCHYVSVDTGETYKRLCQENGDGRIFDVDIGNEGKFNEVFVLSTDKDWAIFSDTSILVNGGDSRSVQVIMNPPEGLEGPQHILLEAESESSYAYDSEPVTVDIMNCYDFEARLTPGTQGDAGQEPDVSVGEPDETNGTDGDADGGMDGMTGAVTGDGQEFVWETMIVSIIIIIVVLVIIYIIVKR